MSHLALGRQFPAIGTMRKLANAFTVEAFFPVTQRIRAAFVRTLKDESARAVEEGMPDSVMLDGTLNTLSKTGTWCRRRAKHQ